MAIALTLLAASPALARPDAGKAVIVWRSNEKANAWRACQQFMTEDQTVPATAHFEKYNRAGISARGAGRYDVSSYVDIGKIRTQYVCSVEYAGDNRWRLKNLITP